MTTTSPESLALLGRAAELRASGVPWADAATKLAVGHDELRKLASEHSRDYDRLMRRARNDVLRETLDAALAALRTHVTSPEPKMSMRAATTIVRYELARMRHGAPRKPARDWNATHDAQSRPWRRSKCATRTCRNRRKCRKVRKLTPRKMWRNRPRPGAHPRSPRRLRPRPRPRRCPHRRHRLPGTSRCRSTTRPAGGSGSWMISRWAASRPRHWRSIGSSADGSRRRRARTACRGAKTARNACPTRSATSEPACHTSQTFTACFRPASGSRVGMNSCPRNPRSQYRRVS